MAILITSITADESRIVNTVEEAAEWGWRYAIAHTKRYNGSDKSYYIEKMIGVIESGSEEPIKMYLDHWSDPAIVSFRKVA